MFFGFTTEDWGTARLFENPLTFEGAYAERIVMSYAVSVSGANRSGRSDGLLPRL